MKAAEINLFSSHDTYSSEEYFQQMLILERKRSKRTGRPFMLILLNIGKLLKGKRKEKNFILHRLDSVLSSATREIDIKGWYMHDSVIGVICQDVFKENRDSVTGKLSEKLHNEHLFSVAEENTDTVKMLCMFYPQLPARATYQTEGKERIR